MKFSIVQMNPRVGDIEHNANKIIQFIAEGEKEGVDFVVFPELALCGYPPKDLLLQTGFMDKCQAAIKKISTKVSRTKVILGTVLLNESEYGPLFYNSIVLINKGEVESKYHKQLLPNYDVFDDKRYFAAGDQSLVINHGDKKIGVTICEDIWNRKPFSPRLYREDPVSKFVGKNIDVLVNVSASPFSLEKPNRRLGLFKTVSSEVKAPLLFCNQVGANDDLLFDGSSCVVDASGVVLVKAASFEEQSVFWDSEGVKTSVIPPLEGIPLLRKALVTGVRDYFAKTGFKKAVLGVSGGIDSAVCAAILVEALGAKNVSALSLPTRYTSNQSIDEADELGRNLGLEVRVLRVDTFYGLMENLWKEWFHRPLTGITMENVQPRFRMNILMAYANEQNALLINTSNKSELAAGYATLYGDTAGALGILGDVLKSQVYALAHDYNLSGNVIPAGTIARPPSAELRPDQKDEDSLPAYDKLDKMVDSVVVEGQNLALTEPDFWRQHANSEFKRRQFPIILKVSDRAFGTGWRLPVAALR